jgi:hypothetical protein
MMSYHRILRKSSGLKARSKDGDGLLIGSVALVFEVRSRYFFRIGNVV